MSGRFQKEIESGRLKPGQKLPPQSAMAKMFGVGMSSIREAVNTLEVMGLLEVTHGSGTFVKEELPLDQRALGRLEQDLAAASPFELFELRELIECHVTRLAAQRVSSDTGIKSIRDALADLADSNHRPAAVPAGGYGVSPGHSAGRPGKTAARCYRSSALRLSAPAVFTGPYHPDR